jgi:predicted small metal-binding protein
LPWRVPALQPPCKGDAMPSDDTAIERPRRAGTAEPGLRGKEASMTKVVRCACGLHLRDADEAQLIARVQQHAKEAHDLDLNAEQVRAMMEIEQE